MSLLRVASGSALLVLVISLTACTPDVPATTPSPSDTPAASVEPAPTITAAALTCESLLGPELWAASGDTVAGQDYLDKIKNEGSPLALFTEYGGVLCALSAGNEVAAFYAASPIDTAAQATQEARLVSEGYVASSFDDGTLYTNETSGEMPPPQPYFFRGGSWWMASTTEGLTAITANWPGV